MHPAVLQHHRSRPFYAEFLEAAFPRWRGIELFGPPGAGKTYICQMLHQHETIRSSYLLSWDELAAMGGDQHGSWLGWLPEHYRNKVQRKVHHHRVARTLREDTQTKGAFFERINLLLHEGPHYLGARRLLYKNTLRNYFIMRNISNIGFRILFDEGFVFVASYFLTMAYAINDEERMISNIYGILKEYPGDKKALLVETDPEECMRRQHSRGHVVASNEVPQAKFHEASDVVADICQKSGWTLARIDRRTEILESVSKLASS